MPPPRPDELLSSTAVFRPTLQLNSALEFFPSTSLVLPSPGGFQPDILLPTFVNRHTNHKRPYQTCTSRSLCRRGCINPSDCSWQLAVRFVTRHRSCELYKWKRFETRLLTSTDNKLSHRSDPFFLPTFSFINWRLNITGHRRGLRKSFHCKNISWAREFLIRPLISAYHWPAVVAIEK